MGKRKTTDQFKQEVYNLVGDTYIVNGEYSNSKTKINFIHNIKGCMNNFNMQPSNFLSGQRCPKCSKEHTDTLKKHEDIFQNEVKTSTNGEYVVVGKYQGANKKIKIKHLKCDTIFEMTPTHFKCGQRCTNKDCLHERWSNACADAKGNTFDEQFKQYENEYIALSKYERRNRKMKFKHTVCGCEFERTPNAFFNNTNNVYNIKCPACLKKIIPVIQPKTQEQFEQEVYDLYNGEYSVIGQYINNNEKITMRHNICGHVWNVIPGNFLSPANQTGCPNCKSSKGERKIKAFLDKHNITFEQQKTFVNLVGVGSGLLSYDFFLHDYNLLIEYQGKQHFEPIRVFGDEAQFIIQKEHDRRKREYAKNNNIDLLEIGYFDFNRIEEILLDYIKLYGKNAS